MSGVIINVVWVLILKRTYNLKYYIFYNFGYHFGWGLRFLKEYFKSFRYN